MTFSQPNPRDDRAPKTPQDYLAQLDPETLGSLTPKQLQAFQALLEQAVPKPSPKLVDLRFGIDLILTRFYVVLLVGRDRRKSQRTYRPNSKAAQVGNWIAVAILLIGLNLTLSAAIVLALYLFKSAIGLDLTPGHISETLKRVFRP